MPQTQITIAGLPRKEQRVIGDMQPGEIAQIMSGPLAVEGGLIVCVPTPLPGVRNWHLLSDLDGLYGTLSRSSNDYPEAYTYAIRTVSKLRIQVEEYEE